MGVLFSILVVALNPGDKLRRTVESILGQRYGNLEIVVKDGLSKDGSSEALEAAYAAEPRLRICRAADRSIYDAMNQAVALARGEFVLFLNCGDTFYDEAVLEKVAAAIDPTGSARRPRIFYGNTLCEQTGDVVHSAPVITGFTCYRNIPCHQSCFYEKSLFAEKQYDVSLRIRADYDHFLWCYYQGKAEMIYLDLVVSSYEGGGYSESRENRARDQEEHRIITEKYMSRRELVCFRLAMALTLAPLRSRMAGSKVFSGVYHKIKDRLYRMKK